MKIGIDATPLKEQLTGVGNYVFYLLDALIQKRSQDHFYLYAIRNSSSLETFRRYSNVTIRLLPFLGKSEALWSQTTLAWRCWKDHIDLFWGTTQSVPLLAKQKSVITIYDFAYKLYPNTVSFVRGNYLRLLGRLLYKKADRLTTISKGTAKRLRQLYKLDAHQVIIPPLKKVIFPTKDEVLNVLNTYSLKQKEYFITVGTLEPRKNLVSLLRAYQEECPLVIVGGKGWRDTSILKELKSTENIRLLGYLPDQILNALVMGAKAFIMPSLYEGYGMPIAEARILGTSVICCDVPEMIEAAEEDALIVPHNELKKAFITPLTPPGKPTYPSNDVLATLLSEEFSKLLPKS